MYTYPEVNPLVHYYLANREPYIYFCDYVLALRPVNTFSMYLSNVFAFLDCKSSKSSNDFVKEFRDTTLEPAYCIHHLRITAQYNQCQQCNDGHRTHRRKHPSDRLLISRYEGRVHSRSHQQYDSHVN